MTQSIIRMIAAALLMTNCAFAQTTNDPYPTPINTTNGVITVQFAEFATIPDSAGAAPRVMQMVFEPATRRFFVIDMTGPVYSVSSDGKTVTRYMDINAPDWKVGVQSQNSERGFHGIAFHPQFN